MKREDVTSVSSAGSLWKNPGITVHLLSCSGAKEVWKTAGKDTDHPVRETGIISPACTDVQKYS